MNFIRKIIINGGKVHFVSQGFQFDELLEYRNWYQMQNFSKIIPVRPKNSWTMGMDTTVGFSPIHFYGTLHCFC